MSVFFASAELYNFTRFSIEYRDFMYPDLFRNYIHFSKTFTFVLCTIVHCTILATSYYIILNLQINIHNSFIVSV